MIRGLGHGAIMIGGQWIQVGLPHAGETAEITIEAGTYQMSGFLDRRQSRRCWQQRQPLQPSASVWLAVFAVARQDVIAEQCRNPGMRLLAAVQLQPFFIREVEAGSHDDPGLRV